MPELPSKWLWKLIEAEVRFGEQLLVHETSDEVVNFGTHWSYVYAHRGCRVNSIGSSRGDLHGLKKCHIHPEPNRGLYFPRSQS